MRTDGVIAIVDLAKGAGTVPATTPCDRSSSTEVLGAGAVEGSRDEFRSFRLDTVGSNGASRLRLLTAREWEVLRHLARGDHYKEIAARLGVSVDTVRTHIRHLYMKLQVHSRTEAVVKYLTDAGPTEFGGVRFGAA